MKIIPAKISHCEEINELTHKAFLSYKDQLDENVPVSALNETVDTIKKDIENKIVLVAIRHAKVIGCIRIEKLNNDIAYIYRFAVIPEESGNGVGSALIAYAIEECEELGVKAIALHTNTKYFKLAKYYYGKNFFVHSTTFDRGYIRALFVKEISDKPYDLSIAFEK